MADLIKVMDEFYEILKTQNSPDVHRAMMTHAALMSTPLSIEALCRLLTLIYNKNLHQSTGTAELMSMD
jgi:hypothetical protein